MWNRQVMLAVYAIVVFGGYTVCQAAGDGPIIAGLNNCKTLIPNALNMRWTLKDDTIDMLLEGVVGPEDGYVSFGFSRPGSFVGRMVGGSVVVGGTIGDQCFGENYYMSSISQCNFKNGRGVCPESINPDGNPAVQAATNATLVQCAKTGDRVAVRMTRKLDSANADTVDEAWPTDGSRYIIYAIGPMDKKATLEERQLRQHTKRTRGFRETLDLTQQVNDCSTLA